MELATRLPSERSLSKPDGDRIAEIRGQIIEVGNRWRADHPFLDAHQNAIGMVLFLLATAGVLADAALYITGAIPWWVCVPMTAFFLSILHELEHDLIHRMYFRTQPLIHNAMIFGVWFLRPSSVNPWIRRRLHLHHHEVSGTESDMEERGITNGERWGANRLLALLDFAVGVYVRPWRMNAIISAYAAEIATTLEEARKLHRVLWTCSYFPLGAVHYGLWHLFLGLHLAEIFGATIPQAGWYTALNALAVVLLAPNALRTFCLYFVSSNMHYYGDVEVGNVLQQTQVWTSKWLWPLHAFCFNFGGTHAIHHVLVRDPFYVREAIARECQHILRRGGVRFDDYQTFRRANRFGLGRPAGALGGD